jgi:hypothetical protein
MAKVTFGNLACEIRGKVGNTTYSRNRGGAYVRTITPHGNARSFRQYVIRYWLEWATQLWSTTLSETQRQQWIQYATRTTKTNVVGSRYQNTALQHFSKLNCNAMTAGQPNLTAPPTITATPGPTALTCAASLTGASLSITPDVAPTANQTPILFVTKPVTPGRYNVNNLFRQLWADTGNFSDNFPQDGEAPTNYNQIPAGRSPALELDNTMYGTGAGGQWMLWSNDTFTNCDLWIKLLTSADEGSNQCGVMLQGNSATGDSLILIPNPAANTISLYHTTAWPPAIAMTTLATANWTNWTPNLTIRWSFSNGVHKIYLDSNLLITYNRAQTASAAHGFYFQGEMTTFARYVITTAPVPPTLSNIWAAYSAQQGAPAAGQKVGVLLAYIDNASGLKSAPASALVTIGP